MFDDYILFGNTLKDNKAFEKLSLLKRFQFHVEPGSKVSQNCFRNSLGA